MKKSLFLLPVLLLTACEQEPKGPTQAEYYALMAERDSLAGHMTELQDIIGGVTTSLDSIDTQEGLLFVKNEDGTRATKKQIMARIQSYKELLERQREQLAEMEKKQKSDKKGIRELNTIIGRLRQEIYDKEQKIAELERDLSTSRKNIEELQTIVVQTKEIASTTAEERDALQEIATAQDEIINQGFFMVGTKRELKDMGVVKGVFRSKADYANLDDSKFTRIDIREFTEMSINGRSAKLITEKPADSYVLTDNGNGTCTLKITNPTSFWQSSQFLIIQVK